MDPNRKRQETGQLARRPAIGYLKWLNTRFVFVVEVGGYVMSALVGVAVIYSLFAKVEVFAYASGAIMPVAAPVAAGTEAVLSEFLAAPGAQVKAGEAVCRVAVTPEDRAYLLANRHLGRALGALEAAPAASDKAKQARALLDALPALTALETLAAPAAGLLQPQLDPKKADTSAAAGTPFALIYRLEILEIKGIPEPVNRERIVVGATARVRLPIYPKTIEGKVAAVAEAAVAEAPERTVTLRFENVPPEIQKVLSDLLAANDPLPLGPIRADIVVGQQSLFAYLFGKKS